MKAEKTQALQDRWERIPRGASEEEKETILAKRQNAKIILKRNMLAECGQKFKNIGGHAVWKWERSCDAEGWELIPESDRVRWVEIPNHWRVKMSLQKKGRSVGGAIPREIQEELDRLIAQHVLGSSDITERKQVVCWDDIDSGTASKSHKSENMHFIIIIIGGLGNPGQDLFARKII